MNGTVPPVCIVLRYFAVGGLERVVIALANAFAAQGVRTRVVVLSAGKRNALITELDTSVELHVLSGSIIDKFASLRELTRDRIVHIHFGDGRIHPFVRPAFLCRVVIVTYHSVYTHKRNWFLNRIDQAWATQAAGIVAVSSAVREFCVHDIHIPKERIVVIENGVTIGNGVAVDAAPGVSINAISVASLYPHKNHGVMLGGLALARSSGVEVRLRIVGDGPSMPIHYLRCLELGLRQNVDWYGAIWRRDIVGSLLASSDIFISGSRFEGLPISVLEAMALGLPLVLSDIPPHREVAGEAALYFPPDDEGALAEHLCELALNPLRRLDLRRNALQRVGMFDLAGCVDKHLALYRLAQ